MFRTSWRQVLQATFLVAVTYTLFYTLATWSLAWATKSDAQGGGGLGFSTKEYMTMLMVSVCVFALFIVLSCVFADRIGRPSRDHRLVGRAARVRRIVPAAHEPRRGRRAQHRRRNAVPVPRLCADGHRLRSDCALLPELFSVNVRYTGSGIGYNIAAIVGAAFVPSVATWLSSHWGVGSVGLYLGVMALCCLVAILTCRETKNVDYMQ